MATNIELYEVLKDRIGPEAARMLADAIPPAADFATRHDVLATKNDIEQQIERLDAKIDVVEHRTLAAIHRSQADITRALLGFFIPLWAGVLGVILTLLLKFP